MASGGESQGWSAGAVDDPSGQCEEPGADGAGDDQLVVDAGVAADGGPADQVVGEDGGLQPGPVGVEVAGRDVVEAGAFFEVADGELDDGVVSVELVDLDGGRRRGR